MVAGESKLYKGTGYLELPVCFMAMSETSHYQPIGVLIVRDIGPG